MRIRWKSTDFKPFRMEADWIEEGKQKGDWASIMMTALSLTAWESCSEHLGKQSFLTELVSINGLFSVHVQFLYLMHNTQNIMPIMLPKYVSLLFYLYSLFMDKQ